MSGYTNGPWNWDGNVWDYDPEQEAPWLVGVDGAKILAGIIKCPNEADARLIATAPQLLEVLKAILPSLNELPTADYHWLAPIAHAAIAKAEGR